MRRPTILGLVAGFVVASSCNHPSTGIRQQAEERYVSDPNSVGFDIEPLPTEGSTHVWLATYMSQGKTAKFRIELGPTSPVNDKESKDFDIQQGDGKFISELGSDASVLLTDLKKSLEAKTFPAKVKRASNLPFVFVTLGKNQSQASDGGFSANPPGNWTPMKIFIGEGEQEGEVFLNINPVIRKGQFSIKDADYGDIVIAQLARVL